MAKKIFKLCVYVFAIIGFILVAGWFAVRFGLTNTPGIIDRQSENFLKTGNDEVSDESAAWSRGEEWQIFKAAAIKDAPDITRAAFIARISPRLIFANLAVEQLRLFHTNRQIFKEVFAPLKILGNQSQFSWGVMGLKQETAVAIEKHLKDPSSVYYLGRTYERLLDFKTNNKNEERFERIIDEESRYYSYLYSALYCRQIMEQWMRAGFAISNRPEIVSTLFNIGFEHSTPKQDPAVGGAAIEISKQEYSFGGLAGEIFYSAELRDVFPE